MKASKKGFTLIELLAVLVILPVLMIIAYPAVKSFIDQTGDQYYQVLEDNVRLSAIDFSLENRSFLPRTVGSVKKITIDQIVKYNEMEQITDKDGNPCEEGYVIIQKKGNNDYDYTVCMTCGEYKTENASCDLDESVYAVDYVLKYENQNGASYSAGTWSSKNIYQQFFNNELFGAEVATYQRSLDGEEWEDFSGDSFVLSESHDVSVRAIDKDGNISESTEVYPVRIDKNPITLTSKSPSNEFLWNDTSYKTTKVSDLFEIGSFGPSGGVIECKSGSTTLYLNDNGTISKNATVSELGLTRRNNVTCSATTGAGLVSQASTSVIITARSTVTFNANGGSVSPTSKTVIYAEPYGTLPNPSRVGYTFQGWNNASGNRIFNTTVVNTTSNHVLNAVWKANTYKVTLNGNGGTPASTVMNVTYGNTYGNLITPSRAGYNFGGWYTATSGGTQITSGSRVNITSNQTLYARWNPRTYTVFFNANGGSVSPGSKTVSYASTYGSLPTPSRAEHTFKGWFTSASGGSQITSSNLVSITANQTLYAHWERNCTWQCDVVFACSADGEVACAPEHRPSVYESQGYSCNGPSHVGSNECKSCTYTQCTRNCSCR